LQRSEHRLTTCIAEVEEVTNKVVELCKYVDEEGTSPTPT
jgi:hypothetical protein